MLYRLDHLWRRAAAGPQPQAMMNGPRAEMLRENAGKFFFNARAHDDGEKIVLGQKIPAGGGIKDGLRVHRHSGPASIDGEVYRHETGAPFCF